MKYLEIIGKNAKKAFEDLKIIKHEKIKCIGSFLKKGRTISTLDSKLFREDGKLAAYATSTWKIL